MKAFITKDGNITEVEAFQHGLKELISDIHTGQHYYGEGIDWHYTHDEALLIIQGFSVGQRVKKFGGSYQAVGTIKAKFLARDGTLRYVFDFDVPEGMLHIFNTNQLEILT